MKDEEHEEGGHERWLVSYADFMTLLFAFFTVLYATSEKNSEKSQAFQESMKRFLIKGGGAGAGGAGAAGQLNQGQLNNSVIEPPIKTYRAGKGEAVDVTEKAETFVEGLTEAERKTFIADLGNDEWGVRLVIPSRTLYAPKDDRFRPEALPFLKKLSGLLAKSERKILIEGHVATDEVGNGRSTWDFASARAVNLLRFVQKTQGLGKDRLVAASLADTRPRANAASADNSRVEIVLLNSDMEL